MAAIGVIVAVRGTGEGDVVARIDAHPDLAVVRRCADLAEALAAAHAGLGMAVVLSPDPRLDRDAIADFEARGLVVLGVAADPLEVQELERLGVEVPEDVAQEASRRARGARPAAPAPAPAPPAGRGLMIAVWGTHGAPGRTTVAANVAAELAAAGTPTLAVDLDTYAPSLASAFAIEEDSGGVAALAHAVTRGADVGALVDTHALAVAPRLRVLPGLVRASRWRELSPAALDGLWPVLRSAAAAVVVDLAPPVEAEEAGFDPVAMRRDAATTAALAEADAVIVVGAAEPRQLQRLIAALVDLDGRRPLVVVNRVRPAVAGARPEREIATLLGRLTGVPEIWPLPWDPRACDLAERLGRTLGECAPRSPLRRGIRALAHGALAAASEPAVQRPIAGTPRAAPAHGVTVTD